MKREVERKIESKLKKKERESEAEKRKERGKEKVREEKKYARFVRGVPRCVSKGYTSWLPPLRGIEHHINLTLGATLPNRAMHRTKPEEDKEIQKQVGKLIEKG
ncbi:hypothetical protein CR513_11182, partial [Mucuna pruriens]